MQFCAQTTWPSGSTVWLGGKFRLMVKEALAPVRVGPSFFKSNVTWPPSNSRPHTMSHKFECFFFLPPEEEWWWSRLTEWRASPDQQLRNLGSPSFHTGYIRVFHERYLVNWLLESIKMNNNDFKNHFFNVWEWNIKTFLLGKGNRFHGWTTFSSQLKQINLQYNRASCKKIKNETKGKKNSNGVTF